MKTLITTLALALFLLGGGNAHGRRIDVPLSFSIIPLGPPATDAPSDGFPQGVPIGLPGVGLGFGCFDGSGAETITAPGVATCVGQVDNSFDDVGFETSKRLDTVTATVHHTDGTDEMFTQMFPGSQTVLPGEHREASALISAAATDRGLLSVTIDVVGVDLGSNLPFHGSWGIGVTVTTASATTSVQPQLHRFRYRLRNHRRPKVCRILSAP